MVSEFNFEPSHWVPFRDTQVIERCRRIGAHQMAEHPNPDVQIQVVKDADTRFIWVSDMFWRIKTAADEGRRLVMILPNPNPNYRYVARMINLFRVRCDHIWAFAMDEYADQDGRIAPEDWPLGFSHAMLKYFFFEIDEELRPPRKQFVNFSDDNINDFGKMIEDMGGADVSYSGPGWTGHLAFVEPDAPEFDAPLEEWKQMGPRIVTLSPFTLAQNSLHGSFGMSGDLAAVPPRAATIGPKEIIQAKHRMDFHGITVHGTKTAWQRLISRLVLHGPVTPKLPQSIIQELRSDVFVSQTIAADIEADFDKGY
jgi:glucosamine-6-phosphate deaminase